MFRQSIAYQGPRIWNGLPISIRRAGNIENFKNMVTVKLLISVRAAINFRCALDPAAIGGRRLLEVYIIRGIFQIQHPRTLGAYWRPAFLWDRRLLEVLR